MGWLVRDNKSEQRVLLAHRVAKTKLNKKNQDVSTLDFS